MPTISVFFGIVVMENWELCRQLKPPRPIPPLE
jgi:hypothetical protein